MHMGEKVKFLKPIGSYLHIAPEEPLGPPFHDYEVFFYREYFLKHSLCPPLRESFSEGICQTGWQRIHLWCLAYKGKIDKQLHLTLFPIGKTNQ